MKRGTTLKFNRGSCVAGSPAGSRGGGDGGLGGDGGGGLGGGGRGGGGLGGGGGGDGGFGGGGGGAGVTVIMAFVVEVLL